MAKWKVEIDWAGYSRGTETRVVEADSAELLAQRVGVLARHHDAQGRAAFGMIVPDSGDGIDPARGGDQEVGGTLHSRDDRGASDPAERDLHALQHLLDVVELTVIEQEYRDRLSHL